MPTLHWLTREADLRAADATPYRLLEEVPALAHGDPATGNMLIQGDNLEALKALLPFYAGQVKCIYIDPPYNTRSAFEHYDDNLEHTQWLAMMWPRLELLRELLSEDGSIWVSIDDNEGHYLKVMMDEVFGRSAFIQTIAWNRKVSPANDARFFSNDHDYIHVYGRELKQIIFNRLERSESANSYYSNPDNDPNGSWNSATLTGNKTNVERPNLYYPIRNPHTGKDIWPTPGVTWRYSSDTMQKLTEENAIYWGKTGTAVPRVKKYLEKAGLIVPRSVWFYEDAGHTQQSMTESKVLFGDSFFGTPKPERLLERIIHIASNPGDLVLDSFLGSGTTAAVAMKMGRRFIGIEMGGHAVTHCAPRLAKVVDGEQGGISKARGWTGGSGFRFWRLGPPVFEADGRLTAGIAFPVLAAHVWFSETGLALAPGAGGARSPVLGVHEGRAYALLYNGVLGDKRPAGGNVLTRPILSMLREALPGHDGPWTVYGERSTLGPAALEREDVSFRQTPYDVKARR